MATCLTGSTDDLITVSFSSMYGLNSSVNLCNETRLIRKFSLHSSGTTIWLTKPVHQAFVRPGLTQNLHVRAWRLLFRRLTDTFLATGIERSRTKVARILS